VFCSLPIHTDGLTKLADRKGRIFCWGEERGVEGAGGAFEVVEGADGADKVVEDDGWLVF